MEKNQVLFSIALLFLIMSVSSIYAYDTTINVKLDSAYNLSVALNVIDPLAGTPLEVFEN